MTSFFGPLPPREPPPPRYRLPDWIAPPENYAPGLLRPGLSVASVVSVPLIRAFPTGWELVIGTVGGGPGTPFLPEFHHGEDALLRLGVLLADGGRLTTPEHGRTPKRVLDAPAGPTLRWMHGGSGSNETRDHFWLWPLPPEGPVKLAFRWPQQGIEEGWVEISGAEVREAAGRARLLWEDDRPLPPTEADALI